MKKLILAISGFIFFGSSYANVENVYYCASEIATGMHLEQGEWKTNDFKLKRWTIKFNDGYTELDGLLGGRMKCHTPY